MTASADFVSMDDAVRAHAAGRAAAEAFVFVAETVRGEVRHAVSYAALEAGSARLAGFLAEAAGGDLRGERVVLAVSAARSFVTALFAIWRAGGVPVPAPAAGRTRVGRERLVHIVDDCAPVLAVADPADAGFVPGGPDAVPAPGLGDAVVVRLPGTGSPAASPADLALLQYTSGSTSEPKGVLLTHANLLANLRLITARTGASAATKMCSWLPLYHDMGLVGTVLQPVFNGGSAVLLPPSLFLKRPYRWLQLVSEHRATATVAPNFGYQLCVDRVDDRRIAGCDFTSWEIALNGSEAISAETVAGFSRKFAGYGLSPTAMRPCYGMAEAALLVSCADPRRPPGIATVAADAVQRGRFAIAGATSGAATQDLVSCGPVHGFDVVVADPDTGATLEPGRIGEVWIRGASVAAGYWRGTAAGEAKFGVTADDGRRGFLRTGDLGVCHDGELYITGRLKDVLVVRGRKLHPHDLEREVRLAHPALAEAPAAVFAAPGAEGSVVAVAELRRSAGFGAGELASMAERVRAQVARQYEVRVAGVAFVRPGQVPRTSSGKVQHARARALYEASRLETLFETKDQAVVRAAENRAAAGAAG
ncbi:fatty acyl-AMP ligase [Amycolatopsis sp. H6(2020)]|nr:fatty acyl-AMP ligase [Amycolatopsis sp. H6(2020)]